MDALRGGSGGPGLQVGENFGDVVQGGDEVSEDDVVSQVAGRLAVEVPVLLLHDFPLHVLVLGDVHLQHAELQLAQHLPQLALDGAEVSQQVPVVHDLILKGLLDAHGVVLHELVAGVKGKFHRE